jgi:hypothetical protein
MEETQTNKQDTNNRANNNAKHTKITQLEKHRTWKRTTRETANNSSKEKET